MSTPESLLQDAEREAVEEAWQAILPGPHDHDGRCCKGDWEQTWFDSAHGQILREWECRRFTEPVDEVGS